MSKSIHNFNLQLVWLCTALLIFLSSFLLVISAYVEWRVVIEENEFKDPGILRPNYADTLLLLYGATCQQGTSTQPKTFPARAILLLSFTALMFLYASYSANIVALLQSPSTKIKTLEDLLASRLKFGVDDTVFNRYYFRHATEETRKAIFERKIRQPNGKESFMTLENGVDKIRKGLFAFHMEQGVGYKIISETYREDEKCGIQEIQYLQVIDPYYAIQKNSSYKEHFKIG